MPGSTECKPIALAYTSLPDSFFLVAVMTISVREIRMKRPSDIVP